MTAQKVDTSYMEKKLTLKRAKEILSPLAVSINKNTVTGEFRVNYKFGGREATAYYTTDINDAVKTGEMIGLEYSEKVAKKNA